MCGNPIGFQRWVYADNTIGIASKKRDVLKKLLIEGECSRGFNDLFYAPDSTLPVLISNCHNYL
jgi:hypothetical protein